MSEPETCPCGSTSFEDGFIEDVAQGKVRWVEGAIEFGLLGNTKRSFRNHRMVRAVRCTACGQLVLFAE